MSIRRFSVLAAAEPDEVAAFVKCLFVVIVGLSSDQISKALAQDMKTWLPKASRVERELGIDILKDIVRYAKGDDLEEEKFTMIAKALRISLKKGDIQKDPHIPQELVDMLMGSTAYMINRSDKALTKLIKNSVYLNEPDITQAFVVEASDQKSFIKPMQKIVKAATGKVGTVLTAEELKSLKSKYPKVHKEYLRLRKDFSLSWRQAMFNFVTSSGKKAVDYDKVVSYLEGQGLQHTLPKGFHGLIDANGKIYTTAGKLIKTMPGPGFSVVMNPEYDPIADNSNVFTTVTPEGKTSQHVYTKNYSAGKTDLKFGLVKEFDKLFPAIQKKWLNYVRKRDKSPFCVASTMLEMIATMSDRIGSLGNSTGGKSTQGLSTLLVKNFKIEGNKVKYVYPGKDGVKHVQQIDATSLEGKLLVANLKLFAAGKEPTDFMFTYEWNGKEKRMTGGMVNKWLTKLGAPAGITVRNLRTLIGTRIFRAEMVEVLSKVDMTKMTQATADKLFKEIATKVGVQLGHVRGVGKTQKVTPNTAIANYIDPSAMLEFYQRVDMRPPKALAKFLKSLAE